MLEQGRDGLGDVASARHQPEQTLLYQLVDAYYPALVDQLAGGFHGQISGIGLAGRVQNPGSISRGHPVPLPRCPCTCAARPNHRWRGEVTPARRGKALKKAAITESRTPAECHVARARPALSGMTWAQRLKRVFNIDIEVCDHCGGTAKVIACIEDEDTIDRILDHLRQKEQDTRIRQLLMPPTREPYQARCLFSLGGIPAQQHSVRKEASENLMTLAVASSPSGMNENELHHYRRELDLRAISLLVVKFSGLENGIHKEFYSA